MAANALRRVELIDGPTPLQRVPQLSNRIGVDIWLKRDDLTGTGLGGNKIRALEFLIGDALARDADCLITGGGPQSNWAMLAALVARRYGLDPYLVYYGLPRRPSGNHALAELAGADIRFTGNFERASVDSALEVLTAQLRAEGRRPYNLPRGGATALGAVGYAKANSELADQFRERDLTPQFVWLATGSCGTQAGLLAGARCLAATYGVVGVTVSRPAAECAHRVAVLTDEVTQLGFPASHGKDLDDVVIIDGYIGPGYGRASEAGEQATRIVAQTTGVFLDPVFGAKAMAALIDAARRGSIDGPVVFLVTGGAPTLFDTSEGQI
ncbi:1-aminocyclopropane-1-carboxylate deaminase/D-cysteine desulfhydrase [Actinocatenispora thailandica]|nr:pyridoxal-phosphate dependent enzyme [Actinocatenispora thailandica]